MYNAIEWHHFKMGFFYGCTCRETDRCSIATVQFPSIIFTENIIIKKLDESVSSAFGVKSKSIDIDSSVNLVINEEDRGENFTVRIGEINPNDKEEEQQQTRTITAEAKLGSMKFEKSDWFNSEIKIALLHDSP